MAGPQLLTATDRGGRRAALMESPDAELGASRPPVDAVTLLTCYLFLLMAIPSGQVVGAFGAAGAPAVVFAAVLCCCYLLARQHPAFRLSSGRQPVRAAAVLFGCATIASYVSANRVAMPTLAGNGADRGLILLAGW